MGDSITKRQVTIIAVVISAIFLIAAVIWYIEHETVNLMVGDSHMVGIVDDLLEDTEGVHYSYGVGKNRNPFVVNINWSGAYRNEGYNSNRVNVSDSGTRENLHIPDHINLPSIKEALNDIERIYCIVGLYVKNRDPLDDKLFENRNDLSEKLVHLDMAYLESLKKGSTVYTVPFKTSANFFSEYGVNVDSPPLLYYSERTVPTEDKIRIITEDIKAKGIKSGIIHQSFIDDKDTDPVLLEALNNIEGFTLYTVKDGGFECEFEDYKSTDQFTETMYKNLELIRKAAY